MLPASGGWTFLEERYKPKTSLLNSPQGPLRARIEPGLTVHHWQGEPWALCSKLDSLLFDSFAC